MATIDSTSSASNSTAASALTGGKQLSSDDFIKLLITQLKNQDPTKPMTNQELLGQVTQIGTLQSQNALQSSLQDITLQNQISSASGMIGKKVGGLDLDGSPLEGVVTSIKVVDKAVTLELDDGSTLQLNRVTAVSQDTPAPDPTPTTGGNTGSGGTNQPGSPGADAGADTTPATENPELTALSLLRSYQGL